MSRAEYRGARQGCKETEKLVSQAELKLLYGRISET
jgi:hypothetical protein